METKPSVFIAIFTMGERDGWLHPSIAVFIAATATQKRRLALHMRTDHKPVDYARNCAVKDFLASGLDVMLMIDNDMSVPLDLLDMLDIADEGMDVLVPKFYRAEEAPNGGAILHLCWEPLAEIGRNQWCELACAGTGVMFVRRRVFERLGTRGWFRFAYDADGRITNSEDVAFCQRARKMGLSVWGNQQFEADHFRTFPMSRLARGVKVELRTSRAQMG